MDLMGLAPSEPKGLAQHLADIQIERENSKAETLEGEGFRFSLIGPLLANQEQTDKLLQAQDMEAKGESAYWIWSKTGWFRSPWDDKWKIEVSDKDFDFDFVSGNFDQLKIKNHPLEKENIPIHVVDDKSTSWAGMFSPKRKEIAINLAHIQNGFNNTPEKIREEIKSTLLHELQHAIQEKEGFEKGANTQHNGYSMPQAVFNMYVKAKAIQDKADSRINEIDKDHNGLISALVSHGAGQDYKAALEEINQFNQLLELAKNIQRADINPLYIRKIGDPLTYEAQRATNWDQYYRKPRSGLFNRTFKSTAHKHAAFSDFFKNYNRLKFEELKKWAQLNNIQWFPENMRDLIGTGGGINKEGLAQYKKQAFSSLKAFIKKFNLKGRENARNTIKEFKKIEEASANIFKLIQKINNDEISAYDAYLRAGGEYEARLVQARAKEGQQGFPLDANRQNRKEHKLQHENAPIPSANRADLWDMAADIRFSLETIEVDGKERPTKNSNGQPIAQSAEGLRNFWRWFGDSKVVDEEGKPLVVYHGARGDFVEFSDSNENKLPWMEGSKGFYFTSNRDVALGYGEIAMPAYIKALNIKQSQNHEHTYISNKKLESLRSNGFDAIYFDGKFVNVQGDMAQTSDEYVVFDPTQIKSATGNTGAFSPDNADIRFSLAPATDSKEFKAWFKDSKVVNEDGSPKVVYHGSSVDFNVFDIRKAGKEHGQTEGTGFYFTENERIGKGYVKDKEKGKLFEVYLSIQKPILYDQKPFTSAQMQKVLARITELEVEDSGMEWQDTFLSNMVDTYSAKSIKNAVIEASKFFDEETALDQIGSLSSMNISKEIINQSVYETLGYDGFKAQGFGNIGDESDIIWVAMFPEQIKSATENTGAFDPKNPDIRYSLTTETPEFKRWFDGSKIVDEEGKPLVVYHGTTAEFTQFEEEFMGEASGQLDLGRGFYFTPDPDTAASFGDGEGSNLMPVFLSIKNPATNRDLETDEIQDILADDMGFTDAQDYLKEQGFDGIVYTHRSGQREIVAFEPEQIKSALGNRGTFDAGNPDIRFSLENLRGVPHPDRPENFVDRSMDFLYSSPMGAAYDRLYQALVDDFNPARRIEQQAGILDRRSAPKSNDAAEESAYVANQMRAGKVRDAIESAENLLRPILKQLRKEGKTLEEAGEFLYAQHAPDYNREMAKINPPRERVQEILEQLMEGQEIDTENAAEPWLETLAADAQAWLEKNGERTEGTALEQASFDVDQKKLDRYLGAWRTQAEIDAGLSGMSTAEAKEIVKQGRQSRGLVALSQAIGQLRDKMRAEMIESGLISFEQGEGLKKYPNYVPLKGWEDETIAESMEQAGRVSGGGLGSKGLSITGADIKRAGGRVTKASNPLGHFLADYQRTIERAQRNRVANKFFELAEKYTEGPWQVWEGGMQRADFVRKPKGSPPIAKISSIPTPPSNTISFKRFGEVKHLQIRDKALLRAMKTLDAQDSNFLFKLFAKYNRVMGALITSLNPEFMITNAIRDAQFAILRAGTDHDARIAAKTAKDYIPSIAQILKSEMGQKTSPTPETKRLERYWREFKEEGTLTGYTITDKAPDALKKMQAELETGFKGEALRAFRAGARQIETLNTAIESMGRLSYYAALRDQGISPKRAAYLAKNLTINFNRRGTAGQALNAWWLFFNAAIQGNAAFARMVKSPKGVAAIGALAAAGLLADLGNGLFGPEDEERDMAEWDKKPMQERSTNLVLMRGKDDSFDWRFPVGYGLNVPFTIGQLVGQAARRKEVSPQDAMIQTALAGINGFSPVRWTNNFVQTATPTIGRIPVDMEVNQDFAGREIARTTGPWDVRPESQKGTDRQSVFSKNLAQFMNEATGGNEWQSGKLDPHPANIDYVIRNSLGGLGSLLGATIALPQEISKNDLTAREVPFVRKVISQRSDFANQTDARNLGKAMGQIEKRAKQDTTFAKERPELVKLAEDYKDLTKQAKKAREEAKDKGAELDLKAQERFWAPFLRKARDLGVEP